MKQKTRNIRFPAELELQSAVMITWPHRRTDWQPVMKEVIPCFVSIAREIIRREKLIIVCSSTAEVKSALGKVDYGQILFREIPSNDTWARDHGPVSIFIDDRPVILDFTFNGWGLKFPADQDNQITRRLYITRTFNPEVSYHPLYATILEGGSIENDGQSTIMTTSQCLLSPNRNEYLNMDTSEDHLKALLGAKQILWLHYGYLEGDDTDCHIDTLARFCDPETIAYVRCTDRKDEHFSELLEMEKELQQFRTPQGKPYRLVPLPMAKAVYHKGERLPATYANFLIINGAILMPTYGSNLDATAKTTLQELFPDREVIGINCLPLIKQHGSLHCVTMQIPAGFL